MLCLFLDVDWMRIMASDAQGFQPEIDYTNHPNKTGLL